MGERPNKDIGKQNVKHHLLADEIAADGQQAEQDDEQQAGDEGQDGAHEAVDNPWGISQPRGEGPDDLTKDNHLRQIDSESALAQQRPPCGGVKMGLAVITLGRKTFHQYKKQGRQGDVVDADVVGNRIEVLLPGNPELTLHCEFKQGHHHNAEGQ